MEYLRFPRTSHLAWLGNGAPRDDKVLSLEDAAEFLSHSVAVEEKVDGANIGISLSDDDELRVQNRGSFLSWSFLHPQFKPLPRWIGTHRRILTDCLGANLILFGEWCYATHSLQYTRLPDWFLAFDVYDRAVGKFWSVERRNALATKMGLATVPLLARGKFNTVNIKRLLGPSRLTDGPAEGIYLRWDRGDFLERRAKLVRAEFTQAITEHWSRAAIRPNQLSKDGGTATAY
jgi:ATP-dependent RNA circularization protein (DNA/RNA ligase family)